MALVYELPYRTSSASNKVLGAVFGDWQVNGIYSKVSGLPFTITASGAALDMPGNSANGIPNTADLNGEYKVIGDKGDDGFYFDPAPFSQPQGARLGNTGRNQFRGPGNWNIDFSIFRGFPIGGAGKRVEFRTEVFNLTNTPLWGRPNNDVTSNNFGRTTTVGEDTPGGARSRDAGSGERQIRFGLRFQF